MGLTPPWPAIVGQESRRTSVYDGVAGESDLEPDGFVRPGDRILAQDGAALGRDPCGHVLSTWGCTEGAILAALRRGSTAVECGQRFWAMPASSHSRALCQLPRKSDRTM